MKILRVATSLFLTLGVSVAACSGGVGDGTGLGSGATGSGATGSGATGSGATGSGATGGSINTGTGGTGTGGTAGTTDGGGGVGNCASIEETAEQKPPILQLVTDISGSMNWGVDSMNGKPSKWEITRDALKIATGQMPETMSLGINFYPNTEGGGGNECIMNAVAVPVQLMDAAHKATISAALDVPLPAGGTPTFDAYDFGLTTVQAVAADGSKFIVLITDGEPTYGKDCQGDGQTPVDNGPLIDAVGKAAAAGVRTFVIGSPGSEPARSDLSAMARAGGTPRGNCTDNGPEYCHFDMTTKDDLGAALVEALNEITGQALGCSFAIPPAPGGKELEIGKVNVIYIPGGSTVGQTIPRDGTNFDCNNGWQYSSDYKMILLCGPTCDTVKADPGATIKIEFGCDTVIGAPTP